MYEVKSFGVTLEWGPNFKKAKKAFDEARVDAQLLQFSGGVKRVLYSKQNKYKLADRISEVN